jgi:hypothetical protein
LAKIRRDRRVGQRLAEGGLAVRGVIEAEGDDQAALPVIGGGGQGNGEVGGVSMQPQEAREEIQTGPTHEENTIRRRRGDDFDVRVR